MPVLIDGYNLLHAAREWNQHRHMDREGLCRLVAKWARREELDTTIVFDGVSPGLDVRQQLEVEGIEVRFSGSKTADDVIIHWVEEAKAPGSYLIVSSDHAIQHAARYCRATGIDSEAFMRDSIHPKKTPRDDSTAPVHEKPEELQDGEVDEWMEIFGSEPVDDTLTVEEQEDRPLSKKQQKDKEQQQRQKQQEQWTDFFDPADLDFEVEDDLEDLI